MSRWKPHCKNCGKKFTIYHDEMFRDNCEDCINLLEERRIMDDSIKIIAKTLNPANAEKFMLMSREDKELVVNKAWEDKILSWKIGGGIYGQQKENGKTGSGFSPSSEGEKREVGRRSNEGG